MRRFYRLNAAIVIALVGLSLSLPSGARAADPIRIGLGMAQTGALAANGKSALLAMRIWKETVNAKGGLLGRPVELVVYDDQSSPATVAGIYKSLIEVDKVDLVVSGYGTDMITPAMPVVIAHQLVFLSLFGLEINSGFHYPRYFTMTPTGPDAALAVSRGFFELAAAHAPKPKTLAMLVPESASPRRAIDGARRNAKAFHLRIVYDKPYPPNTADFAPVLRAVQATRPDAVFVLSSLTDTVGIVRAAAETGLKTGLFGGGMVGLQNSAIKTELGPLMNGIVNYDFWLPAPTMQFPGVLDFLKTYQARAPSDEVDPLGYYIAPWAYAYLQVLGMAVEGAQSLDQDKLAEYLRANNFKTVIGDIKFGRDGELAESHTVMVQFQRVTGNDIAEFRDARNPIVVWPEKYKISDVIYPYDAARE